MEVISTGYLVTGCVGGILNSFGKGHKMLIDLKAKKVYRIEHNNLEVEIQLLDKMEDEKLEARFTKGKLEIKQENKSGFRKPTSSTMILPDVDRLALNIARAQATWKSWKSTSEDPDKQMTDECTKENIEALFLYMYDEYASPIMDKLQVKIEENLEGGEGSEKN